MADGVPYLRPIRNVYLALHQGTDSAPTQFSASTGDDAYILGQPSSYPTCNVPGHHPDSTHIHDDSASPTSPPAVLHENAAPLSAPPTLPLQAPSSFVPAPLHVDQNLLDAPLTNKNMSVSTSFYPTHQTAMGDPRSPGTSSAPVVAGTTQDIETFPRMNHLFAPEHSAFTPPKPMTLTPRPDTVAVEHTTDTHAPFDDLDVPSSPSPTPALDGTLSTGPFLCPDSPVTGADHSPSYLKSHSSMLAPGAPGPSRPRMPSTPHLSVAAQEEGSSEVKAALREEKYVPYLSSTICEDIMANPNLPLRSPSRSPMTTLCVSESLTDGPPIDNDISVPTSLKAVEQTTTESRRIPATSPIPVNTRAIDGRIDAPAGTVPLSSPKLSAIAPPPKSEASTSPPNTVAVDHSANSRTASLDVPSSPSHTQVLTTGPPLTSVSPVFGTDHAYPSTQSRSAILVPDDPFTSPPPPSTSAPGLGSVPEDEDMAGLCQDRTRIHFTPL